MSDEKRDKNEATGNETSVMPVMTDGETSSNVPADATHADATHADATHADATHADATHADATPADATHADATSGTAELNSPDADVHAKAVSDMFSRITPWYDFQNHAFSLGMDFWWRRNLVRSVVPGPTNTVLDLAAGTLDVTLALCRRYPELKLLALDICEPMLDYGMKRKVKPGEKDRITTMVADARSLPLPDASVDAVTIAFGIRNVQPREEALKEMFRVLTPGGRACVLEFAPVTLPLFGQAYHWYLKNLMPRLAGLVSGATDAYEYFADTIANFPSPPAFSAELKQAGFPFVQHIPLTLGIANLHIAVKGA